MLRRVSFVAVSLIVTICAVVLVWSNLKPEKPESFNAEGAFLSLEKQTSFGPRVPGTDAHSACLDYLSKEMSKHVDKLTLQHFSEDLSGKRIQMTNIVGFMNCDTKKQVLLAAHWDSRPTADQEVLPENRKKAISGANDGASGVAVILELARVFAAAKPDVGIVFVLFDGEDYGPNEDKMFLGSKFFAKNMKTALACNGKVLNPDFGILLDMVGDKDLNIHKEAFSVDAEREVVDGVWKMAAELGYAKHFKSTVKYRITDDHIPLIDAGLPCIDIIDFDYPYWHTLEDTPDKCSAESLKIVGDVVAGYVYSLKAQ